MKRTVLAALLISASLAVPAASLRWAAQNDVLTLDPHSQDHATTEAILQHAYEGLTRYNEKWEIEPALATKWTNISPTQVRFELRRGVKFHDGTPFTADDVIFSFNRIRQPQGTMQIYVGGIKEIKKLDDYTIELMLDAPVPVLLRNLVDFRIMSKAWSEKNRATNIQDYKAKEETYSAHNAMGTGPYKITAWVPDQKITLVINPDWWGKNQGNVTEVTYLPIKSAPTRVAALLSGDVDLLTDLPAQDVARLQEDPKLKLIQGKDKRVREALNIALDREAIKRATMRGLSIPAGIMVAPGVNGNTPDIDVALKPDLDKARKLLAEAGYPNGFEVPLYCPNNRYINDEQICQAAVAMWAKVGIKARLIAQPMSQHSQGFQRFEEPLYMLGWGVSTFDALYPLQALARTRSGGADGSFNFSKLSDPKLDALIDTIKFETDVSKRNALIREALLRIRDEFEFIPLHHQVRPWAMKKNVETVYRANDRPEARFTTVK